MDEKKIADWRAGEHVAQPVIISVQQSGNTKNGGVYARGTVSDSSGNIAFIAFAAEVVEFLKTMPGNASIMAHGSVQNNTYASDGGLQMKLERAEHLSEEEKEKLISRSAVDLSIYLQEMESLINGIVKVHIKQLLQELFVDKIRESFIKSPAAMKLHHAYLGGLLEHSVDVARLAKNIASSFDDVDMDVVVAGALLHDIGKIYEISPKIGFEYTVSGNLLGHIMMGTMLIEKAIEKSNEFNIEDKLALLHVVLSHHGDKEKGSPVECKTRESFIVHYADEISTIMNQFDLKDNNVKNGWKYVKFLNRAVKID